MKFKIIIPNLLYFDSGQIVNGVQEGTGYYFKEKLISRYKSELIQQLRNKFNDDYSEENKKKFKDEWKVIHYFYTLGKEATKITELKKKPYYAEKRRIAMIGQVAREKAMFEARIKKLRESINNTEELIIFYERELKKLNEQ